MSHLDHTHVSTGLEDVHSCLFSLLPQTDILIVVDHIDRMSGEPTVCLIRYRLAVLVNSTGQLGQLVAVLIEVDTSFPVPTVLIVDDDTVQCELPTLVLGITDVTCIAAYTRGRRQRNVEQDIVGLLDVVLKRSRQTTAEHGEVDTEVPGL